MKIKTKKIRNKKEKNLMKLDLLFFLICLIMLALSIRVSMRETIIKEAIQYFKLLNGNLMGCLNIIILFLWIIIRTIFKKFLIVIAIYLAYRISRMKVIKENSKYEVIQDIEYYREKFNNITPAEISLISDLEIEIKKDIPATILSLYQKGIIDFSENTVIVKKENEILKLSEQRMIEMIKANDFSKESIELWKKNCVNEARRDNYIKDDFCKDREPKFLKSKATIVKISAILFVIFPILLCIWAFSEQGKNWIDKWDKFDDNYKIEEVGVMQNNQDAEKLFIEIISESGPALLLCMLTTVSFFITVGGSIYILARIKAYKKFEVNNRYKRTDKSKILVEQIAGIKKYIHDFSLLSEKDKESVVLWEDFLIYAVVLEENETIVNDICKYKNINLNVLDVIKRIIEGI